MRIENDDIKCYDVNGKVYHPECYDENIHGEVNKDQIKTVHDDKYFDACTVHCDVCKKKITNQFD